MPSDIMSELKTIYIIIVVNTIMGSIVADPVFGEIINSHERSHACVCVCVHRRVCMK